MSEADAVNTFLTRLVPFGFSDAALAARGGEVILNEGYGLADRQAGIANGPDTVFSLGSITKQFTAAAIMRLQTLGQLEVERSLADYLPAVPADKAGITLHHLLTHSAGMIDYLAGDYDPLSRQDAIRIALDAPLRFAPGTRYGYSNAGYTLLAAITELVSGQAYEAFLRDQFFAPAGMEFTGYRLPSWEGRQVARFYAHDVDNGTNLEKEFPSWALMGNGEMLSTTLDMFRWHQALMGDDYLPADAKRALYRPAHSEYAYGWRVSAGPRRRLVEHGGASSWGSCAYYRRYLDEHVMFIVYCNQVDDGVFLPGALRERLSDLVFGGSVELPPAVAAVPANQEPRAGERVLRQGGPVRLTPHRAGVRLLPLDEQAVKALFPAVENDAADLGRRVREILGAAMACDFAPLSAARPPDRPAEGAQHLVREFCRGKSEAELEVVGTAPSSYVPGALDTLVTTRAGDATLLCVWQDGLLFGCGLLEGDGRAGLSVPCVPVSGT